MKLELNSYGLCFDSEWFYIALDWKVIILATIGAIAYKIYRKRKVKS
jgi:hypothetical protein